MYRMMIPCLLSLALCCCGASEIQSPNKDLQTRQIARGPQGKRHTLSGKASWYGKKFHNRKTACGEPFDMYRFTAAHRTLPFHTIVRVWDLNTRKSVTVRVNDRGPYGKGRVVDLSYAAATDLGIIKKGMARVQLEVLQWGSGARCESK